MLRPKDKAKSWALGALVIASIISGWGCGNPGSDFRGAWEGNFDIPKPQGAADAEFNTYRKVWVVFLPSGDFQLLYGGIAYDGHSYFSPGRARLVVEAIMGKSVDNLDDEAKNLPREFIFTKSANGIKIKDLSGMMQNKEAELKPAAVDQPAEKKE